MSQDGEGRVARMQQLYEMTRDKWEQARSADPHVYGDGVKYWSTIDSIAGQLVQEGMTPRSAEEFARMVGHNAMFAMNESAEA